MSKLPWPEVISTLAFIVLAYWLYPENAGLFILIFLVTNVLRANLAYHTMDVDVYSLVMMFIVMIYGAWPVVLMAIFSTLPALKLSLYIGLYSPTLTIADTVYLLLICIGASFIPWTNYILYGMILLSLVDALRNFFKSIVLHEFFVKYILMSTLYIVINYLIIINFSVKIVTWLGGSIG